jgi:hypothetical protein
MRSAGQECKLFAPAIDAEVSHVLVRSKPGHKKKVSRARDFVEVIVEVIEKRKEVVYSFSFRAV